MDKTNNKIPKTDDFSDRDIFEDSSLLANFENSDFKDTSLNQSDLDILNISALCCDEEIRGFDKLTGQTWIYPTNYPVRDYQFNIIKNAILKNTLVSLPTGLGKTFIAAVIMYNFYRWYPLCKIVFTAPTRPLVAQQIEACYNIVAIPQADTVEMTGHMQVNTRKGHWETKRVFFATPQVIYNDLKSGICEADKIRCLVIDEAHRARGNYAYCQIVSLLSDMKHTLYRVLALSATPGSKVDDVITVVKNLKIAHLELRTESCEDVVQYCHSRKINTVIVELGSELTKLRQQYVEILDVYARRLKELNILPQNIGNLSKGRIMMMYKDFQSRERTSRHPNHNYIMRDFTFLITLYHGLELLIKHGTWVFLNFFDEHPEKTWIQSDGNLMAFLEKLREDLGINPLSLDTSVLPDGNIPEMPQNLAFGHPKFYKLKEIMLQHFINAKQTGQDTKAIVFCEYRESVNLVNCLLLQCRPLIVPQMFVGQGASGKDGKTVVSQKQQLRVMRAFRSGACNTLVCTCVAEEGLDVGSVDLILCFDISNRSPIRLVQRCGRTGRERGGQVFILVTEGREHQTLIDCMRQRDGLNQSVLRSKEVERNLYQNNPRMIPRGIFPDCQKLFIKVNKNDTDEKTKKGQKDLRTMLLNKASGSNSSKKGLQNEFFTKEQFQALYPTGYRECNFFENPKEYFAMDKDKVTMQNNNALLQLSTWLEDQKELQKSFYIGHSSDAQILTNVLQYNDKKKDLPPSNEMPAFNTQDMLTPNVFATPPKAKIAKKKQKNVAIKSPGKKDGDIRSMFSTATKSTKSYSKLINEFGLPNDGKISTRLINLFVDLSLENKNMTKKCWYCLDTCNCRTIQNLSRGKNVPSMLFPVHKEIYLPDISMTDEIDGDFLLKFLQDNNKTDIDDKSSQNSNIKLELDSISEKSKSEAKINETNLNKDVIKHNFDIGDIEDIFAESSPEEAFEKEITEPSNCVVKETTNNTALRSYCDENNYRESIEYFHLKSIDDLFEESDSDKEEQLISVENKNTVTNQKPIFMEQKIIDKEPIESCPSSPSLLSGKCSTYKEPPTSPILSQSRKFKLSINRKNTSTPHSAKKQLQRNKLICADSSWHGNQPSSSCIEDVPNTSSKSMLTITQTIDMINGTKYNPGISERNNTDKLKDNTERDRSTSPILLTQRNKKKNLHTIDPGGQTKPAQPKTSQILIILDSDSDDSDFDTKPSKSNDKNKTKASQNLQLTPIKRKLSPESENMNSPFFNKRQKITDSKAKPMTLQEKVLAALTCNTNHKDSFGDNNTQANFMFQLPSPSVLAFGKENRGSQSPKSNTQSPLTGLKKDAEDKNGKNGLSMLQIYRRDSNLKPKNILKETTNTSTPLIQNKRKITFSDSDDDFEIPRNKPKRINGASDKDLNNHKIRKKKKNKNSFLDLEAVLSGDSASLSGDELSDESVGSIIDFICDDTYRPDDDMHAHYIKSVKSPVRGVFKIPQLPEKFNKMEVLSQTVVDDDNYEMDSFCVDSHVGLTQVNEVSDLELAEMILEGKRRNKKTKRSPECQPNGSPLVRKKLKRVKRQIDSDSDDSS